MRPADNISISHNTAKLLHQKKYNFIVSSCKLFSMIPLNMITFDMLNFWCKFMPSVTGCGLHAHGATLD